MPFVARCPFCRKRIRFPDAALGESIKCPRCENPFTAAAMDEQLDSVAPSMPVMFLPPVPTSQNASPSPSSPARPLTSPPARGVDVPVPAPVDDADAVPDRSPWLNPLGVLSLACAGVGLVSASISFLTWATIPLCGAGFLLAVAGLYVAQQKQAVLFPALGGTVALPVVVIGILWPSALGATWARSQREVRVEADKMVLVARQGDKESPLEADAWADCTQGGIKRGSVQVDILKVVVHPVETRGDPKSRQTRDKALQVFVRVRNVGFSDFLEYQSVGDPSFEGRVKVATDQGETLAPFQFAPGVDLSGRLRRLKLAPGGMVDDVVLLKPPPASSGLRVELPAEAWGGQGTFRYIVPAAAITDGPPQEGGSMTRLISPVKK